MKVPAFGSLFLTSLTLAACGGGGGGTSTPTSNPPPGTESAVGLWKGTITSTGSGQTQQALGTVTDDGQFHLMTANGVNYVGQMAASPGNFSMTMSGYVPVGQTFPNGAQNGSMSFSGTVTSSGMMSGTYSGAGESGTFSMTMDPMGTRSASMQMVAGTYTRSNSSGYTVTMTVDSNGQMTGSDTQGCVFNGTVSVPFPAHNFYGMNMTVTSCGALNGSYNGMGTLVDANAMTSWMTVMMSSMMTGGMMGGMNAVPTGTNNLFMYSMANAQMAITDSIAK